MGCWGITAFESDEGLDTIGYIRRRLPQDGRLELGELIKALEKDHFWLPDASEGATHSSAMTLAEIAIKMAGRDFKALDYADEEDTEEKKFADITSFSASKGSLRWLRGYLHDTLQKALQDAEEWKAFLKYNGWFHEKDWIGWQEHMKKLVGWLDVLLDSPGDIIELLSLRPGQLQEDARTGDVQECHGMDGMVAGILREMPPQQQEEFLEWYGEGLDEMSCFDVKPEDAFALVLQMCSPQTPGGLWHVACELQDFECTGGVSDAGGYGKKVLEDCVKHGSIDAGLASCVDIEKYGRLLLDRGKFLFRDGCVAIYWGDDKDILSMIQGQEIQASQPQEEPRQGGGTEGMAMP